MGTPSFKVKPAELKRLKKDNLSQNLSTMAKQTSEYRRRHPNEKHGGIFSKDVVLSILKQPGCVALRYYFGIDRKLEPDKQTREFRNPTLIICGVDKNGDDMLSNPKRSAEKSWACPPDCSLTNPLFRV